MNGIGAENIQYKTTPAYEETLIQYIHNNFVGSIKKYPIVPVLPNT